MRTAPGLAHLQSTPGIGPVLGLTILLENGDVHRFAQVGDYASYCRCVDSKRMSNGKQKGRGNAKCGNKYLAWAYIEAANYDYAIRYSEPVQRWYQRRRATAHRLVALKAVAHKLARCLLPHAARGHRLRREARLRLIADVRRRRARKGVGPEPGL